MDVCRTCLKTPAQKHILQLEKDVKDQEKNSFHIMVFCLDIEVTKDSKITANLCKNCYRKIISFYKFKALSQKNDAYLKSLDSVVELEDQKLSVYIDENGIKHENFLDSDDYGSVLVEECNTEYKIEIDMKEDGLLGDIEINVKKEDILKEIESDEEPLSAVQKVKYENINEDSTKNVPVKKKIGRPRKTKVKEEYQVCEECGKSVRDLKAHSRHHLKKGERPLLPCELCPKIFITKSGQLKHHRSIHLGLSLIRKSVCDICNKEVKYLKDHKMMKHNPETLPYGCVSCERRYRCRSALEKHIAKHVGVSELPYECDICQRRFRFKDIVSKHIRKIHQNEKNYQCEFCSKTFFEKQPFISHLDTHSTERRHKCKECGFASKTQDSLRKHRVVVHSGVRNYHCTLCTKSFKIAASLKDHMLVHSKERPHQCQFCDMRFRRRHHRKRHEAIMHKNCIKTDE